MNHPGEEFVYRLPAHITGTRPGAHKGRSRGSGMSFAAHARLFDLPDPRRLDLRASISNVRGDWLVRTYQQPASITIYVLVDLSASMHFGTPGKITVAADFLHSLGTSAHGYGDAITLLPFDDTFREDLYQPAQRGRAIGARMAKCILDAQTIQQKRKTVTTPDALNDAINRIEGRSGLVFLLSDFHWSLDALKPMLDRIATAALVPIVIWDKAELIPPEAGQVLFARELGSRKRQQLWLNESARTKWLDNVQAQRELLTEVFAQRNSTPLFIDSAFSAKQLSRYFMEQVS